MIWHIPLNGSGDGSARNWFSFLLVLLYTLGINDAAQELNRSMGKFKCFQFELQDSVSGGATQCVGDDLPCSGSRVGCWQCKCSQNYAGTPEKPHS